MIKIKNNYYRNLEEQVQFLTDYHDVNQGLVQWGIRVVGQVETAGDLPVPYEGEYGDAIAVGTEAPFFFYIWTRASIEGDPAYWFPFGEISIVGPQGPKGDKGDRGEVGPSSKWYAGAGAPYTTIGYNEGDMYLSDNGQVFRFENENWRSITNIKGANGIQGIQGPQGPQGPAGPQGEKGEQGDVGGFINIAGIINEFDEYGNPILPTPSELGDLTKAYLVGASAPYDLYIQVGSTSATATWKNTGPFNAATLVTSAGVGLNIWDADTKLDKVTTLSQKNQAYVKTTAGDNRMFDIDSEATANTIVRRRQDGTVFVPTNTTLSNAAISKYQADGSFVAKMTGTPDSGATRGFMYGLQSDGTTPELYRLQIQSNANTIPLRNPSGNFYVGTPTIQYECTNKAYVDNNFVPSITLTTGQNAKAYIVNANGQAQMDIIPGEAKQWSIPQRGAAGIIYTGTPTENGHATTKKYVDDKFLAKKTGITSEVIITQKPDGTTDNLAYSTEIANLHMVRRTLNGDVLVNNVPVSPYGAVNKNYINGIFSLDGTTLTITTT